MPRERVQEMLERHRRRRRCRTRVPLRPLQHTNTVKAHELLHFAKAQGRQHEMAERLMSAYFTEGRTSAASTTSSPSPPRSGSTRCRARRPRVEPHLADVRADQAQAQAYGIQGVPFFVIDGTYGSAAPAPRRSPRSLARCGPKGQQQG
jgi:hypothetical protein